MRAALPAEYRSAFNDEIDSTELHRISQVLADWDARARALADPAMIAMVRRIASERAGHAERPPVLSDAAVRALAPSLRP
ncbi:hypothetical protein PV410_24830 [Streptomyces sp. PA03-5A]|nr:hypothetical protein [Streptomyces sp. PA03-5A]